MAQRETASSKRLVYGSVVLALVALLCFTAATVAWMSIADRTRVRSMRMEITTGANLRFDLDAHRAFEEYTKTLTFLEIRQRIQRDHGFDPAETPLAPVTTGNGISFVLEDQTPAETGQYLEFVLHFIATDDMVVHLTSAGSDDGSGGTQVSSSVAGLPNAMRISFTTDKTSVFDPGMGDRYEDAANMRIFGLPNGNDITYNEGNALFSLEKEVDKPVTVRIWIEGTDEACTDALRNADYRIQLRFVGTDENGNLLADRNSA